MTDVNTIGGSGKRDWLKLAREQGFYFALVAFFFLLPLQTRYIFRAAPLYEYGTLSVYAVEVLGWVVIVLGLVALSKLSFDWKKLSFVRVGMALIGLAAFGFLSILWAPDKAVALQAAARLFEGILFYWSVQSLALVLRRGQKLSSDWLAWCFIVGAALQAILGIQQFLTQSSFASTLLGTALHDPVVAGTAVVEFGQERWLRAYGGLPHPNVLGGYLVVALAVLMLMIPRGRASKQHCGEVGPPYIVFAIVPILLTGIFFSFSRAAWVGAVVVVIVALSKLSFNWKKLSFSGVVYVLLTTFYVLLLAFIFRPLVEARLAPNSAERLEVKSRVERVQGAQEAWQIIKQHPLVGVGIGNYTQAVQSELRLSQPLYAYQPVHNVPLLVVSELGIVGLLLFGVVLYLMVKKSRSAVLLFCCFAILLMADHYLWTLPFGILLFWGILGLSTGRSQNPS